MKNKENVMSDDFQISPKDASEYSKAWMEAVEKLDKANLLDGKTKSLAYLSVLAALGLTSGIPFHVQHAKSLGVTRSEIIGMILVRLPATGHKLIQALPIALEAYDT